MANTLLTRDERIELLFQPTKIGVLDVPSRIVMPAMTRAMSPGGVPTTEMAGYYRRRAEADVGLIITEGTFVPHETASNEPAAPRFYGADALEGWSKVVEAVHTAGGLIMPQLWHVGQMTRPPMPGGPESVATSDGLLGPSGMVGTMGETPTQRDKPATDEELVDAIEAYATAAASAHQLGFDGVELQGAHGYLIDQFFWSATNRRDDRFGGDVAGRTAFAVEIVKEIKRRTSPQFPVILRISQFKMQDFGAQLFETPHDLERFVGPLNDAGVDAYHCSQRRFWEGEFGSDLNLAGWTKRLSGRPTISVGSLMLSGDIFETMMTGSETSHNLHLLLDMMERGDFDMIAVGRGLLVDPEWARKVRTHAPLSPYSPMALGSLS